MTSPFAQESAARSATTPPRPDVPAARVDRTAEPGCEFVRFATDDVLLGEFRCPPAFADFRSAGRIRNHVIAFPRSAVWIAREDERAFVSDPSTAVLHAPGRAYERSPISREGDETDWIAVADPIARELVARHSRADAESPRPFARGRAPVSGPLYREQRRLFLRARDPGADAVEIEERALAIVASVLAAAYGSAGGPREATARRARAGRDLVEAAKELLAATLVENLSVRGLAERLDVSPFHLCRTFRAATGRTLHEHRRELRLRLALGMIPDRRGGLSSLALELGFHSHAHLSSSFRRLFGVPPSAAAPWGAPSGQR